MDLFGFAWCCFAWFCLVLLVLVVFFWFGLVLLVARLCFFAWCCLDLLCFACCLVSVGGERPSDSSDQMMVVGVLVAFAMVLDVVVVV